MINTLAYSSIERVSSRFQSFYKLRLNRIHKFKEKIGVRFDLGSFQIKTITNSDELKEALALRFDVFHRELRGGTNISGIDIDEFDFHCDHLIVKDRKSAKIIATYRLNCSLFTETYHAARSFNLSKLLKHPGVKVELGRACIQREYRKSTIYSLLWRGVAEYMAVCEARILFGCATVMTDDPRDAALLTRYFDDQNRIFNEYRTRPTIERKMPLLDYFMNEIRLPLSEEQIQHAEEILPSFCKSYLSFGASIGGEPAWNQKNQSIDFLTILQRDDLNRNLWSKNKIEPKYA